MPRGKKKGGKKGTKTKTGPGALGNPVFGTKGKGSARKATMGPKARFGKK